jgi:hypothetical protein
MKIVNSAFVLRKIPSLFLPHSNLLWETIAQSTRRQHKYNNKKNPNMVVSLIDGFWLLRNFEGNLTTDEKS